MTTLVNAETGELLDAGAAERRAMKISLRLDSIAENFEAVMPMIREAIELGDHLALNYKSPGDYVRDRFGGALTRLPIELRRETVRELTAAGLSTRAIAPVVGVSEATAWRDASASHEAVAPATRVQPSQPIVGVNGKTYSATRVAPRLTDEEWAEQQHKAALEKTIRDGLGYISDAIQFLDGGASEGDRFVREYWPHHDKYLTGIRAITPERVDAAIAYLKTIRKAVA